MEELFFTNLTAAQWLDGLRIAAISVGILIVFYFLANILQRFVINRLLQRLPDPLLSNFLTVLLRLFILLIGLLVVFKVLGLTGVVSGILAGAGISAFVVGFALKDIGENFLAGILLAFKRPFRLGDVVDIDGLRGKVLVLNMRDTQIKTIEGKDVFIPNALIIKKPLTNFTIDGFLRYDFMVSIPQGIDYPATLHLIKTAVDSVPGVLKERKETQVWVADPGEATLQVQVEFWVDTFAAGRGDVHIKSDVIIATMEALRQAGLAR